MDEKKILLGSSDAFTHKEMVRVFFGVRANVFPLAASGFQNLYIAVTLAQISKIRNG